jgi:hypothetical protein
VVGADCTMFVVVLDSEVVVHGVVAVCVVNHTVPRWRSFHGRFPNLHLAAMVRLASGLGFIVSP